MAQNVVGVTVGLPSTLLTASVTKAWSWLGSGCPMSAYSMTPATEPTLKRTKSAPALIPFLRVHSCPPGDSFGATPRNPSLGLYRRVVRTLTDALSRGARLRRQLQRRKSRGGSRPHAGGWPYFLVGNDGASSPVPVHRIRPWCRPLSDNDSRCSFRISWRSRCFLAHARIEFVVLEFSHEMPATRRVHAACAVRSASPY